MGNEYTQKDILTIRIDKETKEKASVLFASMGLPLSTAINIFLKQCIRESRIPFELSATAESSGTAGTSKTSRATSMKKKAGRKPKSLY